MRGEVKNQDLFGGGYYGVKNEESMAIDYIQIECIAWSHGYTLMRR